MPGYIKLYRDLQENPIWNDKPFSKGQVWADIIFRCNHVCKKIVGYGDCTWILRGQFISSNYKLADAWGWSESSVRQFIKLLVKEKMITVLSGRHYTLYEVTNYCVYQSVDNTELEGISNAQKTHRKRTGNALKTLNNNDKNYKNDKKELKDYSSEIIRMAETLKSLILQNNPGAKTPDDLTKWQSEFDKMKRIDKRTDEQIFAVMEFSQKDPFWKSNILSAGKLREQFDRLFLKKEGLQQPPSKYRDMTNYKPGE